MGQRAKFSDKLRLVSRATEEREAMEIDYVARDGKRTRRIILPHLLVYKQNIWYVYAFCRLRNEFRLFKIGRMRSVVLTGETFERIPFSREDVPLSFWTDGESCVDARFQISKEVLPFAEEWLGIENVYEQDGKFYADVTLPDDERSSARSYRRRGLSGPLPRLAHRTGESGGKTDRGELLKKRRAAIYRKQAETLRTKGSGRRNCAVRSFFDQINNKSLLGLL